MAVRFRVRVGLVCALAAAIVAIARPADASTVRAPFGDAVRLSGPAQEFMFGTSAKANGGRHSNLSTGQVAGMGDEIELSGKRSKLYSITQWGDCRLVFELKGKARVKLLAKYDVVELASTFRRLRISPDRWTKYEVWFQSARYDGKRLGARPRIKIAVGGRSLGAMREIDGASSSPPSRQVNCLGEQFGRLALEADAAAHIRNLWVGPLTSKRTSWGPWRKLFDGRSLDGWMKSGGKAHYEIRDGVLVGQTRPNTGNTFLATEKDYGDFEFECETYGMLDFNGGIQFRSEPRDGKNKKRGTRGYQYELDPSGRAWSAGVYDEARRSWLHPLSHFPKRRQMTKKDTWHKVRIVCVGSVIKTYLNGVLTTHLYDAMTPRGYFGMQVHGVGKNPKPMDIKWRNIRIRELR